MLNEQTKQRIDQMSYQDMLSKWRFAAIGDPMFQGETGDYFAKVMAEKRKDANHVQASKNVRWDA